MLAEFFDRLKATALEAEKPSVLVHPGLPHDRTFVAFKGLITEHERVPPDRRDVLEGLDDLLVSMRDYKPTASTFENKPMQRSVFVGPDGSVVCTFGEARFDRSTMRLRVTERWALLSTVQQREFSQKEAVQFIRFNLHAAGADALLAGLRALDFQSIKKAGGTIQHGKETLGRSIESSVAQADRVPEQFTASVPVFQNAGFRDIMAVVKVAVYLDPERERIKLMPLADELPAAWDTALAQVAAKIAAQVEGESYPHAVVLGTPS